MSEHDLVIRNATVVDGTGAAPVQADVAVSDGRVTAVGPGLDGRGSGQLSACCSGPELGAAGEFA